MGVAVTPDGNFVYVANAGSGDVSVIDTSTNTVVDTVDVGNSPNALGMFIGPELPPPPPPSNGNGGCSLSASPDAPGAALLLALPVLILIRRIVKKRRE